MKKLKLLEAIKHPGSILYPNTYSNERYIEYLTNNGVTIGKNTRFINPNKCQIDVGRGDYITIGDDCCLSMVTILAHDYSWYTLLEAYGDMLPDSGGKVEIGNNCFIGYGACILKNTHIGDNVIIGARSVVKGNVPSNTVWAGIPARMICTLEDFYERRKKDRIKSAYERRDFIRNKKKRNPTIKEMGMFSVLFLDRTIENYDKYIKEIEFNGATDTKIVKDYFFSSQPEFNSFEEFLEP